MGENLEDPALDILVTFLGIQKKSQTEKNSNSLTSKEEETDGHQTSQVQWVWNSVSYSAIEFCEQNII